LLDNEMNQTCGVADNISALHMSEADHFVGFRGEEAWRAEVDQGLPS
jgi:hypothetical protein